MKLLKYACVFALLTGLAMPAQAQTFKTVKGRLVYSCDGNYGDRDDIGGTAMTMMLIHAAGQKGKLVHLDYADYVWGNDSTMYPDIKDTVTQGRSRFGISSSVVYDAHANPSAAINHIASEINISTASNPITLMAAGPMYILCEGIKKAKPEKRQYVTLLTHGLRPDGPTYNQSFSKNGSCNLDGIKALRPAVNIKEIKHGNFQLYKQNYNDYEWMHTSNNSDVRWVYSRMKVAIPTKAKPSDAQMMLYMVTGSDTMTPADIHALLRHANYSN